MFLLSKGWKSISKPPTDLSMFGQAEATGSSSVSCTFPGLEGLQPAPRCPFTFLCFPSFAHISPFFCYLLFPPLSDFHFQIWFFRQLSTLKISLFFLIQTTASGGAPDHPQTPPRHYYALRQKSLHLLSPHALRRRQDRRDLGPLNSATTSVTNNLLDQAWPISLSCVLTSLKPLCNRGRWPSICKVVASRCGSAGS